MIKKWEIYHLPRKFVEPNSNGTEDEKRPIAVIDIIGTNVIIMPITKVSGDSKWHVKIKPFSANFPSSYLKISVVQTISIERLNLYGEGGHKKVDVNDRANIASGIKNLYKI